MSRLNFSVRAFALALLVAALGACSNLPSPATPTDSPTPWVDATTFSEWAPNGTRCAWGPASNVIPSSVLIEQTGVCGALSTITVTPQQRNAQTGELRATGLAYTVDHLQQTSPATRKIYGDYHEQLEPLTLRHVQRGESMTYLGVRQGLFGRNLVIDGTQNLGVYLLEGRGAVVGAVTASGFSAPLAARQWLSRYAVIEFVDGAGNNVASFSTAEGKPRALDPKSNQAWLIRSTTADELSKVDDATTWLSPIEGGVSLEAFFQRWSQQPKLVSGIRLHN